jgi:hypothetical protein
MRWFKNRVLSKMFGLQSGEVRYFWRKDYDDELYFLYSLHQIGSVFGSRWMRWAWYKRWKGRGLKEDRGVDGKRFT